MSHITIDRKELLSLVQQAGRAVSTRSPLPILQTLRFSVEGTAQQTRMSVTGDDNEVRIESALVFDAVETECLDWEDFAFCVKEDTISSLLHHLTAENVTLTLREKHRVQVECGKHRSTLLGYDPEEFPQPREQSPASVTFSVPQKELKEALESVVFASSHDTTKLRICGVYVEVCSDCINFVATDSRRVALYSVPATPSARTIGVILPTRAVELLVTLLDEKGDKPACVHLEKNTFSIQFGTVTLYGKTIQAQYPDYRRLFPTETPIDFTADREETLAAVERAGVFHAIENSIDVELITNSLRFVSENRDTGNCVEDVDAEWEGEEWKDTFHYRYLRDCFKYCPSERVRVQSAGNDKPVVVSSTEEGKNWTCLLAAFVPVRR